MNTVVRKLEARLLQAQSASECLDALLELAQVHATAFRNREGLRSAREALNIARARNDMASAGKALATATLCHFQRGDFASAVATGLDAIDAYSEGDAAGRSSALQSIALALFAVDALQLAQSVVDRAVADARASGDPAREASARSVCGVILAGRGCHNAARRHFRIAGGIHRRAGDIVKLKKTTSNLAHSYRHQANAEERGGNTARARLEWRQAIRIYRTALATGPGISEADDAIILGSIAECECRLGAFEEALADVTEALRLAVPVGSAVILGSCHLWQANILRELGRLDAARRACADAQKAAEQLEDGDLLADCLRAEARLHDLAGRFESAQDLERRAADIGLERHARLERLREEMRPLWDRYISRSDPRDARDAA